MPTKIFCQTLTSDSNNMFIFYPRTDPNRHSTNAAQSANIKLTIRSQLAAHRPFKLHLVRPLFNISSTNLQNHGWHCRADA